MKKLFSLLLFITSFSVTNAQEISLTFQSQIDGTKIDSIWVTNQDTGQKIKLLANETLILIHTTGNKDLSLFRDKGYLYPNPCQGESFISFSTQADQEVEIKVTHISGKMAGFRRQTLPAGHHMFRLIFPVGGVYAISVAGESMTLSYKAVCTGLNKRQCTIDYSGNGNPAHLKNGIAGKSLDYAQGQVLLYSAYSNKKNSILTDSPSSSKSYSLEFYDCIDPSYRSYACVKIGTQIWMAENLAYLPSVSPPEVGSSTAPRYYVHSYSGYNVAEAKETQNYATYGVLYNWPAAVANSNGSDNNPSGVRGICPEGWHLPSDEEWKQLEMALGMTQNQANDVGYRGSDQGKQMKATSGWALGIGSNSTGFSALGGGDRGHDAKVFGNLRYYGYWWSSLGFTEGKAVGRSLGCSENNIYRGWLESDRGLSVRCIMD